VGTSSPRVDGGLLYIRHKKYIPPKSSEEIAASRSKGERLQLKEMLMTIPTSGSSKVTEFDAMDLFAPEGGTSSSGNSARKGAGGDDDDPANRLEFLQPRRWKPSGAKPSSIPDVLKSPARPASARSASQQGSADGGQSEAGSAQGPKVNVGHLLQRLWHDDIEKRKTTHKKALEKALAKTECHQPNHVPTKPGEEPPKPPDTNATIQRLFVDDIKRRETVHEKAMEKVLKKKDPVGPDGKPRPEPKIEDLEVHVDRLYNQARSRHEANKEALLRKLKLAPQPPKKLTKEAQRAQSARLYNQGVQREKEAIAKFVKKYIDDRTVEYPKLTDEELKETSERLVQKKRSTS
jgi:hypothetical protein